MVSQWTDDAHRYLDGVAGNMDVTGQQVIDALGERDVKIRSLDHLNALMVERGWPVFQTLNQPRQNCSGRRASFFPDLRI